MQSNDQGIVGLCKSWPRGGGSRRARGRCSCDCAAGCSCAGTCRTQGLVVDVAPAAAIAAWLSRQMGQFARRSPTGLGLGQSALAVDVPGAAGERAAALHSMARHASAAAATAAPALAAVQESASGTTAARTRILQPISADAPGAAHGIAQAVASNESRAAAQRYAAATAAAQSAIVLFKRGDSRVVSAFGVRHYIFTAEKHIAKYALSEHLRLIGEMRR